MPKALATDIAKSLRSRIESGEWTISRRLPNERELAAEYKVARNTLRRAMDRIVSDGTVTREVGRGTFLRQNTRIGLTTLLQELTGVSPIDLMAVRQIFEPQAAAMAATNASAGDLNEIAAAHSAALEALDMETFEHCDAELHQRIFAASRNELLKHLHVMLRLIRNQDPWRDIKRRSFSPQRRLVYCEEHKAIVDALMRRDAEAAATATLSHLDTVSRNLFARSGFG
jgi:DNA-binding FadR family transcriptional regulator